MASQGGTILCARGGFRSKIAEPSVERKELWDIRPSIGYVMLVAIALTTCTLFFC